MYGCTGYDLHFRLNLAQDIARLVFLIIISLGALYNYNVCLRIPNLASVNSISRHIISGHLSSSSNSLKLDKSFPHHKGAREASLIFGGDKSELQAFLMSGTYVWLKLQAFNDVSVHN